MAALWDFLSSAENRAVLAWLGGGLCVAASGLWVVVRHFTEKPAPKPDPGRQAAAGHGIAAAGRDIRIGDPVLGRLALGLAALGMVLLALALLLGRGNLTNAVSVGGDVEGSTITIGTPPGD